MEVAHLLNIVFLLYISNIGHIVFDLNASASI